jgi:DNA-cytosine methyltransferase
MTTFMDLFAGAGGWSLGLSLAGFQHRGLYEISESANRTALHNLGPPIICCDLTNYDFDQIPKVDVIVGSPPCQGFSNEGYKNSSDPRNTLIWTFLDVVEQLSPKIWAFENVLGFRRLYGGEFYHKFVRRLQQMDYYFDDFDLNAANYGAPQKRIRFFAIGAKTVPPSAPPQTHSRPRNILGLPSYVTLWEAISDLPPVAPGERKGVFDYQNEPTNEFQRWAREGSTRIYNHTTQKHSARMVEKMSRIEEGEDMSKIVGEFGENRVHYCGGYRRAKKGCPSYTAYWTRAMTSIHPEQHRLLSPRECARIQSFPDRFLFQGTTIENYTQICNAVPPLVARAFGIHIEVLLKRKASSITEVDRIRSASTKIRRYVESEPCS